MISVTGYYNGKPVLFGRGETEEVALTNAKKLRENLTSRIPRLGDPRMWDFKRDAFDRQMFQPST